MASNEQLKAWRDELERILYTGIREAEYTDMRTAFRSQRDLEVALAKINERLGSSERVSKIMISSQKGL
jgi:hypothetical protein